MTIVDQNNQYKSLHDVLTSSSALKHPDIANKIKEIALDIKDLHGQIEQANSPGSAFCTDSQFVMKLFLEKRELEESYEVFCKTLDLLDQK